MKLGTSIATVTISVNRIEDDLQIQIENVFSLADAPYV